MFSNEEMASGEATAQPAAEAAEEVEVQVQEEIQEQDQVETEKEGVIRSEGDIPGQDEAQEEGEPAPPDMEDLAVEDWDYERPRRGQVRTGLILAIRDQEIIIDVGAKRDGIVPYADMQRLGPEAVAEFSVGDEVRCYILRPEDKEGNLLVSLYMARQAQAWEYAQELYDKGEVWETEIVGYNKGGVVVPVKEIRGFVPASQVPGFPMGIGKDERLERLSELVGEKLQVKVIEINQRKRRLILSATAAQKQWRRRQRERLLEELREGEVRKGVVSSLASFGAFVDLGGADGLVHISELSWRRVRHPKEVVSVGQEVEVYVLRLDHERNRIGLSLKRLQPEPWALVEDTYELGQLVEGVVTNVVDFGAFAEIEAGIEGLIHVSELADMPVGHPKEVVKKGDLLLLRIIRIDARRKRMGLSLKRVLESEWAEWAARLAAAEEEEKEAERAAQELEASEAAEEQPVAAAVEEPEEPEAAEEQPAAAVVEEPEEPEAAEEQPTAAVVEEPEEPEAAEEQPAAVAVEEPEEPEAAEEQPAAAAVEEPEEPEAAEEQPAAAVVEEPEEPEQPEQPEAPESEEAVGIAEPSDALEDAEQPEAIEEPEPVEEPAASEDAKQPQAQAEDSPEEEQDEASDPASVDESELAMAEA